MKQFNSLILIVFLALACQPMKDEQEVVPKPRLLITTDIGGDPDDTQSLIRLMLYTNEFDMEGFVASASGTIGELDQAVVRTDLIEKIINAYAEVQSNLKLHDPDYPLADSLLALVKPGNPERGLKAVGEGHLTTGSEWIIQKVDESDKTLNVGIWGGQTDLAQALWQVKNDRSQTEYQQFVAKLRVHDIADQDSLFPYIKANHPDIFYILNRASLDQDKRNAVFRGMYLDGNEQVTSLDWLKENVIENHGPLGALYPQKTWTAPNPYSAMKEGDTPSWFFFLPNGLNIPEHPEYGGWGGRFEPVENQYFNDAEDTWNGLKNARVTLARWREDFQNALAARMDWCVKGPKESNHRPVAIVNDHRALSPLMVTASPGENLSLDASKSYDPDDDQLQFDWMIYPEAGDLDQQIELNASRPEAVLTVPELNGRQIHLILRVSDNGSPSLTGYKRIIINN
ncbi:MAG: nucleoside hydrolase-like domain-containing protein [Candidatus Cyclobacteriaceae bacterium M3_2C_046]